MKTLAMSVTTETTAAEETTADGDTTGDGMIRYQIIAGERRWRAALAAGLSLMPVIVRDGLSPTTVAEVALVENLQRTDLDPIEEARGYGRLIREFSLSEDRVAKRVGRSRDSIRQSLKLLHLPKPVQELIAEGKLTPTHGQVMRKFARFPELCEAIANTCVEYEVPAASLAQEIPNDDDLLHEGFAGSSGALQYGLRFPARVPQLSAQGVLAGRLWSYVLLPSRRMGKEAGTGAPGEVATTTR